METTNNSNLILNVDEYVESISSSTPSKEGVITNPKYLTLILFRSFFNQNTALVPDIFSIARSA
jgi:hypothetical protein